MATVSTTGGMTLIEQASREFNGGLLDIVNILSKTNRLWLYAQWAMCNNGTVHKGTRTSTEPTGTWRDYDEGVAVATATTAPYEEPTGMLDHTFTIDKARKKHAPNPEKFVNDELEMQMRGIMKQAMTAYYYGDRATDTDFAGKIVNGLTQRTNWNTLSSEYVYDNAGGDASATANKTSIWIQAFGPGRFEWLYPSNDSPGSMSPGTTYGSPQHAQDVEGMGITMYKLNSDVASDGTNEYPADKIWFEMHWGIDPIDPRYTRRVGNVSTTNIDEVDDFSFNEDYLIDAITDMPDTDGAVVCCNRKVLAQIWKKVKDSSSYNFSSMTDAFGTPVPAVCGLPVVLNDAIVSTEATLS
jgi:hypothetical protein